MESVVVLLGLSLKCVSGRRCLSVMFVRSSAMHANRIFAMVSRRVMGW